jgi:hypothetical protein
VSGLHDIDAAASGNSYVPDLTIAQKAAGLIAENFPRPAEDIPFYRHEPGNGKREPFTAAWFPPARKQCS